ncbi:MAG: fibronectin type III domain-containing protein, partial [Bacteroidota bacterium]
MKPKILLFLLCFLGALHAGAQIVFPLQIEQRFGLLPSRLTDFSSDPLAGYEVSVNALDPFEPTVQLQLRLRIEGPNVRITSLPNIVRLHQVNFGTPLLLAGNDLAYLFSPANLAVEGIDAREFWRDGGLFPEGFYNVCLEAFLPARSDELGVSAENCVPLFVNLAEPPLVTYPVANQTVPALTPANFAITWLDQGTGGMTQYDLEITPYGNQPGLLQLSGTPDLPTANGGFGTIRQNINPVQSFSNDNFLPTGNGIIAPGAMTNANAPLLFRSGLSGLSYQLQPDDPALLPGGQYLIRVRAYDPFGTQSFRNGGWSQPVLFTYGERCPAPGAVTATPVSDSQVRLSWSNTALGTSGYSLRFRSRTGEQGNWTAISTNVPTLLVDQLSQNTAYDYELRANCGGTPGNPTFGVFTTPGLPNTEGDGNPTTAVFASDGETPYQPQIASCSADATPASLATGSVDGNKRVTENENFKFYGLDIRPVQVSGGTSFNGKGTLLIPWLEQGAVAIKFQGIKLNANGEAVMGTVTPIRGENTASKIDLSKFSATLGTTEDCANYTETKLDARGFDDAGIHYLTGTEFDPYGFDRAGNYQGQNGQTTDPRGFNAEGTHTNGTNYDDSGCDRDSLNQYGQPCVWRQHGGAAGNQDASDAGQPNDGTGSGSNNTVSTSDEGIMEYGTVSPGAATTAGTAYLGTIPDDSLRTLVRTGVDTMLGRIDRQLQGYTGLRSLLATGLDYYINLTGLERDILLGPNDEFLQPGMSQYFPSGIPAADSTDREFVYWGYDKAIRGLYQLDKHAVDTLQPLQTLYQNHQTGDPADQLTEHLKRHLRALTPTTVSRLTNSASELQEWVRRRVSIQVSTLFRNPSAGYSEWYVPSQQLGGPRLATSVEDWVALVPLDNDLPDLLRSLSVTSYDPTLGFELPLKIEQDIAGKTFSIYIDDLKFSPAGIQVDAFCILPIPGKDGEYVAFKGENIPLTKGGFQGKQKLSLVSQLDIGLGTFGTLTLPTNSQTYVEFSCDGYEGFSLDGQVLFCRDKLIPVDATGELLEAPNRVTADFQVEGTSWPNFLIQLDVDKRFAVKGLRDIYWLGDDIWVDFSEDDSPEVVFPDDYQHAFISGGQAQPQWRGVHVRTLDVTVDVLAKREDGTELGFTAQNLVVDDSGLTVKATARNVLTKEEGRIGKWKIGVDTVLLHLQQSAFKAARITGNLVLPTDDADEIGFVGQASSGGDFSFSATLEKDKKISWDMWDGELTLAQNTSFEILRSATTGWDVQAKLYGRMNLGIEPTAKFTVPDIVFEDLRLASFQPYVDLGPSGRFSI